MPTTVTIGTAAFLSAPTIQALILMFSGVYVLINLLIDLTYSLFDPRIRPRCRCRPPSRSAPRRS
jgi:ABC-type dipeptide/oligopeptide/nickel transport system permease component